MDSPQSDADAELLYLSRDAVAAAGVTLPEIEAAIERAFVAKAKDEAILPPKTGFRPNKDSAFFFAMPAAIHMPPLAGLKWVTVGKNNEARGLPSIAALVVLNNFATGLPRAVMDGSWITAVRTAATSAIAARHLARADSRRIGFVACGVQARSHLAALAPHFPLCEIHAYSRRRATAEAFAHAVETRDLTVKVVDEPRGAVAGMDIVVTSVPPEPGPHRFLDPDWLAPGAFATLVDLGRSWQPGGFSRIDRVITDDRRQSEEVARTTGLPYGGPFAAELGEILTGAVPARRTASERIMFLHPGVALADLATAAVIHEHASAKGIGVKLPL